MDPLPTVIWSEEAHRELPTRAHGRALVLDYFATRCCGSTERWSDGESSGDLALDPTNQLALANLENFYHWLRTPESLAKIEPCFAMSSEEIDIQLAKVRAIGKARATAYSKRTK